MHIDLGAKSLAVSGTRIETPLIGRSDEIKARLEYAKAAMARGLLASRAQGRRWPVCKGVWCVRVPSSLLTLNFPTLAHALVLRAR